MLGNVQNNVNFGSLRIAKGINTQAAIGRYIDCMDTARVMSNSLSELGNESGDFVVEVAGKILKGDKGDIISFQTKDVTNSKVLQEMAVQTGDFVTSRAKLFEKFCADTLVNVKKLFE